MDVPDLVRQAVGDEELRTGVNLGDEDAIVFTATRALVYRGEGLLSDEDVSAYGFDFERLAVSEGRRKTKFTMSYVEGERSVSVPGKRTDDVLERLIEGMLRVGGAIDVSETVTGVFRFSEMTLVVTEGRLLKHIGEYTWDADFEAFAYDDLTELAFEEGSVATQVVLSVGNRSERIKAPNAEAGLVRKSLQEAVFAHYGVGSLEQLNREIAVEPDEATQESDVTGGFGLDSGIDPLVSEDDDADESDVDGTDDASPSAADASAERANSPERETSSERANPGEATSETQSSPDQSSESTSSKTSDTEWTSPEEHDRERSSGPSPSADQQSDGTTESVQTSSADEDTDEITEQLSELTQAVERQNELLNRQQGTIETLIEELRQGR